MKLVKINQKEYDILKELDDKWKWIARDQNRSHLSYGYLFAYANKPSKSPLAEGWKTSDGVWLVLVDNDLFQFIKWEDEEPHNIAELIKEYEKDYKGSWEHAIEFSKEMRRESEETEVNEMDKEKLIDLLDRQTFAYHEMQPESPEDYTSEYKKGYNEGLKFAIAYIDQLDEPTPQLSGKEWLIKEIDDYMAYEGVNAARNALIFAKAKINQLDEPELPVIPQFVAKYLDFAKSDTTLMRVLELANTRNEWEKWEKEYDWIEENHELFARAWLDGYEVEKEQKYYVKEPTTGQFLIKDNQQSRGVKWVDGFSSESESYTEKEIKAIDERFWPFAAPVEEDKK